MEAASEAVTEVALGYFGRRFAYLQWEGVAELLSKNDVSPQVAADVLRSPPPVELPWTRVDAWGEEVATEYWSRVGYYDLGIPQELSQLLEVCRRLRKAGRLESALPLLAVRSTAHESHPEFAEESAEWLEQWVKQPSTEAENGDLAYWRLVPLFKVLDKHRDHLGTSRVAILEWQYHPLLRHQSTMLPRSTATTLKIRYTTNKGTAHFKEQLGPARVGALGGRLARRLRG